LEFATSVLQIDLIPFVKDVFVPGSEEPVDVPGKYVLGALSSQLNVGNESRSPALAWDYGCQLLLHTARGVCGGAPPLIDSLFNVASIPVARVQCWTAQHCCWSRSL
jgi:hypothetical protein